MDRDEIIAKLVWDYKQDMMGLSDEELYQHWKHMEQLRPDNEQIGSNGPGTTDQLDIQSRSRNGYRRG